MSTGKKKLTITVNLDEVETQLVETFRHFANHGGPGIPRGAWLSRAFYLLMLDEYGPDSTNRDILHMKVWSQAKGSSFKEEVVNDREGWEQYKQECYEKWLDNWQSRQQQYKNTNPK